MPTVFGEGKVAQFTTMSYPYSGFFVGLLGFILLILAVNFKNKYFKVKES
jgi:cell division protein FtsX